MHKAGFRDNRETKIIKCRGSLVVQWLGLHAFTAEGVGLIPRQGTKILQAGRAKGKKKCTCWKVIPMDTQAVRGRRQRQSTKCTYCWIRSFPVWEFGLWEKFHLYFVLSLYPCRRCFSIAFTQPSILSPYVAKSMGWPYGAPISLTEDNTVSVNRLVSRLLWPLPCCKNVSTFSLPACLVKKP